MTIEASIRSRGLRFHQSVMETKVAENIPGYTYGQADVA